jgi:predicted nucleic acid-binding protein
MPFKPTHILDACAVIAYLKNEPGADVVAELISNPESRLAIHSVNATEVYYNYLRSDGQVIADQAWQRLAEFATILPTMEDQFLKRVARWVTEYNPGLADAFGAATAEEYGIPLVTADHKDFETVQAAGALQIVWIR